MLLNLGSGGKKLPGYVNVDSQPMESPDVVCDLSRDKWPFEDNSVDGARASHLLEHLGPEPERLFHFMQELYRVCKDGAPFEIWVPNPRHDIFLNDPTHVRPIMPATMMMFCKESIARMAADGKMLTPFYKYLGVDFRLNPKVQYNFSDPSFLEDPDLLTKMTYLNNVVFEFHMKMTVVK